MIDKGYPGRVREPATFSSYIHITDDFVQGLKEYIRIESIPLSEVAEVFAGSGELAGRLGLPADRNYSDNLLFASDGYEDDVNEGWERNPPGVVVETAYNTVIRFAAEEGHCIGLMIMGAPLPAHSNFCPSYEAAKAVYHLFGARILYIGERPSEAFASPKFFKHVRDAEAEPAGRFRELVQKRYDGSGGYFASADFDNPVCVQPYLLKFSPCSDPKCDCRDDSRIRQDVEGYRRARRSGV